GEHDGLAGAVEGDTEGVAAGYGLATEGELGGLQADARALAVAADGDHMEAVGGVVNLDGAGFTARDAGGHGDADHTGLPRRYRGGGAGIGLGEVADRFHRVDGQIGGTSIGHGDGLRRTGSGNGDAPEEEGGGG